MPAIWSPHEITIDPGETPPDDQTVLFHVAALAGERAIRVALRIDWLGRWLTAELAGPPDYEMGLRVLPLGERAPCLEWTAEVPLLPHDPPVGEYAGRVQPNRLGRALAGRDRELLPRWHDWRQEPFGTAVPQLQKSQFLALAALGGLERPLPSVRRGLLYRIQR